MGRQPISPELSATISIEWELVHQGIELIPRDESETTMNFYMGRREISWSDLHQQADINRTIYERIKRNVEKVGIYLIHFIEVVFLLQTT